MDIESDDIYETQRDLIWIYSIAITLWFLVYMFPFLRFSTQVHLNSKVSHDDLSFHRFFNRVKLNTQLVMILVFSLSQAVSVLLIMTQLPLVPFQYQQTRWDHFKTLAFMFIFSFSGAILDTLYLFLNSYHLRLGLPAPARLLNDN